MAKRRKSAKNVEVPVVAVQVQDSEIEYLTPGVKKQPVRVDTQEVEMQKPWTDVQDRSPYRSPACPWCKGDGYDNTTYVQTTRKPIRYIKCKRCGFAFKDIAKIFKN